jgi:hypothetical protein
MLHVPRPHSGGFVPSHSGGLPRRVTDLVPLRSSSLWTGVAVVTLLAVVALIAAAPRHPEAAADPAGRFTTLPDPRVGETETKLPGGTLLVAGGQGLDGKPLASAELYDPRTGTWTPTGSMHVARWRHTATLLLDGTVFVAGGTRAGDSVSRPEIYDPRTGTWTPARRR